MASDDKPETVERVSKEKADETEETEKGGGGFLDKVKGFVEEVGEKIEEAFGFSKPTAEVSGVHIPHINHEKADIVVDVLVKNPNPVPIPLVDMNYLVDSDGRKLASGLIPNPGTIHAHGSETVKIPVTLIYDDIKSTYKDIKPGNIIPYRVRVDLIINVPVLGKITIPVEKTGEIPVPYRPEVDVEKIHFEKFSFEETMASLRVKIENKNDFELALKSLDYQVWLGEHSIGGAELQKSANIGKHDASHIDLPVTFHPKEFGSALWGIIRGKATGYTMKGNVDVDTPFGAMKLPISKEGGTTRLKKKKEDGTYEGDDED